MSGNFYAEFTSHYVYCGHPAYTISPFSVWIFSLKNMPVVYYYMPVGYTHIISFMYSINAILPCIPYARL